MVGGGFNNGAIPCAVTDAQIDAFNNDSPNYTGSSVQFAAFATSTIDRFASKGGLSPKGGDDGLAAPQTLTFANSTGQPYGGNFGSAFCINDYSSAPPLKPGVTQTSGPTIGGAGWTNLSGNNVHTNNADVVIGGNIMFSAGGWGSPAAIPTFYLIVTGGDIYIDSSVTQLDGVYVAEPSGGAGGNIYTCTNQHSFWDATTLFSNCLNKLKIDGAFAASQVSLLRTSGSLQLAAPGEISGANAAAEEFNYSPAIWLNSPFQTTSSGTTKAEAALPPIL